MSTAGVMIGLGLALVVLVVVLLPVFGRREAVPQGTETIDSLRVHYERVLTNIRDLDEDYALGKIQADFYNTQRALFASEGVEVLRRLDALQAAELTGNAQGAGAGAMEPHELDDRIEAAIAAKKATGSPLRDTRKRQPSS